MAALPRTHLAGIAAGCLALALAAPAAATVRKVKNNHDAGQGSLRVTVAGAANGDKVVIPAKVGTIKLTSGEIDINKGSGSHLTITGAGPTKTTVSGNGASRIFRIDSGTVSLQNMTLTKGHVTGESGGAVYDEGIGSLSLSHVAVTRSSASSNGGVSGGGGIYDNGGNMSLTHSTVSANRATVTTAGVSGGGGIYSNGGNITLKSSKVAGNRTTVNGNALGVSGGGGIYTNGGNIKMSRSRVTGNRVKETASVSGSLNGGGGIYSNGGNLKATKSTLAGNSASLSDGAATDDGGGAWYSNGGSFSLNSTTISGNKLTATVSGSEARNGGGAIYLDGTDTSSKAVDSTIAHNKATINGGSSLDGGGALFEDGVSGEGKFTSVTVAGNSTNQAAGGLYDAPTLDDTIVADNSAAHGGNCAFSVVNTHPSASHNLSDDKTCNLNKSGDRQKVNPKLGNLANNGGPTKTVALLKGSPAIDHADAHSPSRDQRGFKRDAKPDIGAFELGVHR